MEKKKKLRRKYARKIISDAIESKINDARNTPSLNAFLYLIDRFRPWINSPGYLETGRACFVSVDVVCSAIYEVSAANKHWIRQPFDWTVSERSNFRAAFASLIRHLMATHEVPPFMDHVWWSDHSNAGQHRKWFRHIAKGYSVRGIVEARIDTKAAARRFMESPDHFSVDQALAQAKSIAPVIKEKQNFGLTRRREKRILAGKTVNLWRRINTNDFYLTEVRQDKLNIWKIVQIRDQKNLIQEGKAMRHCVATYSGYCDSGKTTIWSMQRKIFDREEAKFERALTIEVLPNRLIIQALGFSNRSPRNTEIEVLKIWAEKENLRFGKYVC